MSDLSSVLLFGELDADCLRTQLRVRQVTRFINQRTRPFHLPFAVFLGPHRDLPSPHSLLSLLIIPSVQAVSSHLSTSVSHYNWLLLCRARPRDPAGPMGPRRLEDGETRLQVPERGSPRRARRVAHVARCEPSVTHNAHSTLRL